MDANRHGLRFPSLTSLPRRMSVLTPELLRQIEQFQLLAARRAGPSPSAQRMNMNSRGRQPTESPPQIIHDPEGGEHLGRAPCGISAAPSGPGAVANTIRGCQPTEQRPKANSTLKGANHEPSGDTAHTFQLMTRLVRPFQGRGSLHIGSVGFTHGYSCCSPSANAALARVTCAAAAVVCNAIPANSPQIR